MLRHSTTTARALGFGLLLSLTGASTAFAAPKDKPKATEKKPDAPSPEQEALRKQLAGSEDEVVAALKSIAESGDPAAAPLVGEVFTRGGTPKVLDEALKAASKLKAASLSAPIAPYVQHRTEEVRRAAARTLLKTKGADAIGALRRALRSADAVVRGVAATGLGALAARDALPDLFTAFDHGVAEAGAAIGQLCAPDECEQFAERTGKVAFDVMVTGFDQVLFRPPTEIPDDAKIRLVGRMRELGTAEVGKYLGDVGERWPKDWSKRVKQAIDGAARAVGGNAKK